MIATISQIAEALGISRQAVLKRARDWQPTGERVQGGGDTYDIDTLQLRSGEVRKIKTYLAKRGCKVIPLHQPDHAAEAAERERQRQEARAQSLELFGRLPADKQAAARARLDIITTADAWIVRSRLARTAGQDLFCHEYNLGRVDITPATREQVPQVAAATLRTWIAKEHELGMMGLVDMYGNRKGQSKIETDEQLKATLVAIIIDKPHIKPCHANESLRALCPDSPWVSDKSVERYMIRWKKEHAQEYLLATNPDQFKNKYQAAFGSRSENIDGPNLRWEIDATPADLLLVDGRHKIIGICDVGTRRLDLYVTKTERARDNAHSVRRCLLAWGVPDLLKTDNGTYKAETFKQVMRDLEIEQRFCKPFSGDEKPFIERAFRTFSHDLVELLPGYCGHSVAERKDIEARKSFAKRLSDPGDVIEISMTAAELQSFCDRWTATYHGRVHSELGRTPNDVVRAWTMPIRRITDERALDVLLSPVAGDNGQRTVGKKGIRINGHNYIHPDLHRHIGEEVRVLETDDLGTVVVHATNQAGLLEFVCLAQAPALTGISMAEVAAVAKARQTEHKAEMRRHAKEMKKGLGRVDIAQAVLEHREKQLAERERNVTHLPRPSVEYTTPALQAAGAAAAELDGTATPAHRQPAAPAVDPVVQAAKERIRAEIEQSRSAGVASLPVESAKARYKRMTALRQRITDGDDVTVEEYAELRSYEQTNEYKALKGMEEEAQRAVK